MSLSMVKGNVICKCRVQKNLANSNVAQTILTNLLVSSNTGSGLISYDLSLTDDNLYVEALRKDIIGLADVAYTDIIPRKDIKKFVVIHEGIKELVTLVATIRGKEETLSCYRENTKEDYIATIMQGLLEPSYVEEGFER
jgi:hypothetical protein